MMKSVITIQDTLEKATHKQWNEVAERLKNLQIQSVAHTENNSLIVKCAKEKCWNLVENLLRLPDVRANAHVDKNIILYHALEQKQWLIAKDLLTIPEVANNCDDSYLLWKTEFRGQLELVEILLSNPNVLSVKGLYYIFRVGIEIGRMDIFFKVLLAKFSRLEELQYTPAMRNLIHDQLTEVLDSLDKDDESRNFTNKLGFNLLMLAAIKLSEALFNSQIRQQLELIILKLLRLHADFLWQTFNKISFLTITLTSNSIDHEFIINMICEQFRNQSLTLRIAGKTIWHALLEHGITISPGRFDCLTQRGMGQSLYLLDQNGNSALSYLFLNAHQVVDTETILRLIHNNIKFVRNYREIRSSLQLKVLLLPDSENYNLFTVADMLRLDFQDENGYTALHYACIQNKRQFVKFLLQHGANMYMRDKFSRTPIHYAAINGFSLETNRSGSYFKADITHNSPILYGLQNAKSSIDIQTFVAKYNLHPSIPLTPESLPNVLASLTSYNDYKDKISLLSALKNYCKHTSLIPTHNDFDGIARQIIAHEFAAAKYQSETFTSGFALGIELEISGLTDATFIPLKDLVTWFNVNQVEDLSVKRHRLDFKYHPSRKEKLEFTSEIIDSCGKYHKFLAVCQAFANSGAKVNYTCGAHVHVNVRGSKKITPELPAFVASELEFIFIKYVAINYMQAERLLIGFLRDGQYYSQITGATYLMPIIAEYDKITEAQTIDELLHVCDHSTTLDLPLYKHGTIEFRIHEGIVDPILLNAWVDFVTRIIKISHKQALAHTADKTCEPYPDIEQLVYILICMREYNKTWDPLWGATKTAISSNAAIYGNTNRTAQEEIIDSPLYNLMLQVIKYDAAYKNSMSAERNAITAKIRSIYSNIKPNEQVEIEHELRKLIDFAWHNPGISSYNLDLQAIHKFLDDTFPIQTNKRSRFRMDR